MLLWVQSPSLRWRGWQVFGRNPRRACQLMLLAATTVIVGWALVSQHQRLPRAKLVLTMNRPKAP